MIETEVLKWGGIAGALAAVCGLICKLCRPIGKWLTKGRRERREFQEKVLAGQKAIEDKLDDTQRDIAYLQMHELKLAHARLMLQGWCPEEERASLLALYDRYKEEKGRDTLADSYKNDIASLSPYPPRNRRAGDVGVV